MSELKKILEHEKSSGERYAIYEYHPRLGKFFYKDYEKMTFQKWIRFFFEWLKGYAVYYLEVTGEIVGYCVISKGGGRYSFAEKTDIVVGPYFVLPEHRGHHYSELIVSELLHYENIKYNKAYDWIRKTNVPSLKCSASVGLHIIGTADVVKPFRQIVRKKDDSGGYYILMGSRDELVSMKIQR